MEQGKAAVWQIWERGQVDPKYVQMLHECRRLERAYEAVLQALPYEQRDIICDYVTKCEEMSWRLLEIACEGTDA